MGERAASWFAIVLMAAVLGTSYWYAKMMRHDASEGAGRVGSVDFFAETIALTGFDSLGRPRYRMFADRMTHFGNSDDADLVHPRLLSLQPGQPQVQAVAQGAHAVNNAQVVKMFGEVVVTREADSRREPMRLETTELTALPDEDRFWTDAPVRILSGRSVLSGKGMDFDNITHRADLRSDVAGTFPPRGRP